MNTETHKRLLAIVDSDPGHRQKLCKALISFYNVWPHKGAKDALNAFRVNTPSIILINFECAPWDPHNLIKEIRAVETLKEVPIIYLAHGETDPQIKKAYEAGASAHVVRPYTPSMLVQAISQQLNINVEGDWDNLAPVQRAALKESVSVFRQIADVLVEGGTVNFSAVKDNCQSLVTAIEGGDFLGILDGVRNHDDYTYAHSMRVATLLTLLGHAAGFNNDEQLLLSSGGLLHDVGKMKIPHNILNKPGRLTTDEFEIMKSHVPETVDYLKGCSNIPKGVFIIAEQHHEKIDGTGYPHGLKGSELNELARMAAIVDVFSALTDRRVYKEPMEASKAMDIMREEMTGHLDQHFVKMFEGVLVDTGVLK